MSLLQNVSVEGTRPFEVILSEGESIARETVTVVSGQTLSTGAVLGVITASGKYTAHDPAAVDGSEDAAAILLSDCDASGGDAKAVVLARLAEVKGSLLVWKSGIAVGDKAAGIAALAAKFIIVRN